MTNALAVQQTENELIEVMQSSIYPGAQASSIRMALGYCRAAGLDPLQKPVHIVPMYDRNIKGMRDVIMPGIGLYRTQAARSGQYVGMSEPEFGPDVTETIGGMTITYPDWCKVTVRRLVGEHIAEFSAIEYWRENYAVKGGQEKSIAPNAMWAKRPRGQIAKCARAQALREGFPELVSADATAEEMEGKAIGDADIEIPPRVEVPDAIREIAEVAADGGVERFREYWKSLPKESRAALRDMLPALQARAQDADSATIDVSDMAEVQP